MKITPVPIRSDNYMYLLEENSPTVGSKPKAFLIDPAIPDALERIQKVNGNVDIVGILTTHHHKDHAGGNSVIAKNLPSIPIYGGKPDNGPPQVEAVNRVIKDGDKITLGDSITITCMATPCHTRDSICYYVTKGDQKAVFTGDTLFQGGCGRFFEGTPAEMHTSLSYLGTLPDDTVVYNGHEYTRDNLKFVKTIDPSNSALSRLQQLCDSNEITAGKSTLRDEKAWNVFMRLESGPVQCVTYLILSHQLTSLRRQSRNATGKRDIVEVMKKLREMKNAM